MQLRAGRTAWDGASQALGADPRGPATDRRGITVTVEAEPDAATLESWDRLVTATPRGDVAQLSGWAQVRRQAGFAPTYLLARLDGRLAGGALVLRRRLPAVGAVGYLPHGPLLPLGDLRAETAAALTAALADLARRGMAALFVQPPAGADDVSDLLLRLGFRRSEAGIAPSASIAIDLSAPIERLHAGLASGTRADVARARKRGVQVREGGEDDLPLVADLFADTADHHQFVPPSLPYLRAMHQRLAPQHVRIAIAERDGIPLAADLLTAAGGVLTLRLTGMRRSDGGGRTGATALLRWESIIWAKANGYDCFDAGGVPPAAVAEIRAGRANLAARVDGRTYFKASFGGSPFHYPQAVELFGSPLARLGYDVTRRSGLGHRVLTTAKNVLRGTGPGR